MAAARLAAVRRHLRPEEQLGFAPEPTAAEPLGFGIVDIAAAEIEAAGADDPLARLARNEIGAIVLRNAIPPEVCRQTLQRVHDRGMVPPSYVPFLDLDAPSPVAPSDAWRADLQESLDADTEEGGRFDIGMSLAAGAGSGDPDLYFERCRGTQAIYQDLFAGVPPHQSPYDVMYDGLTALSGRRKRAVVAYERDGREYGPCIIRTHKPFRDGIDGASYALHYDSVRVREERLGWEVHRFPVQLAGIIVLQGPDRIPAGVMGGTDGRTSPEYHDSVMYQYSCDKLVAAGGLTAGEHAWTIWPNEVHNPAFRELIDRGEVPSASVDLEIGDMCTPRPAPTPGPCGRSPPLALCVFVRAATPC